ncbi:cholestenol Delta-isomerase [Entomortierella parvispora]|uniref:Cholestenol Delta-isomerase n=1 Tax=Entomortierella parvispora TaxID=205924 RepID=A0A9P3HBZ4_9FUNG|nr:cholestenol Delta-isomerase [Entomortierella parvispora]
MTAATRVPHPYYPLDLVLDNYVPNTNSMKETLTILFSTFGVITVGALVLAHGKRHSTLKGFASQSTFLWFTMCGFIHFFLEGYWGINHANIAADQTVFGQIWKEYSLSDSRYLSNDSFILIMENITAFAWGPLSFYTAWAMYNNKPGRHITQLIVSLGQFYGCVLYYLTTMVEGSPHCDPHPYYYYFYFGFMNIFWMIVPLILLHNSIKTIYRAMKASLAAEAAGTKHKKSK